MAATLGHFYRGEVERMVSWRSRLDQTTNWSVVLMAAILTFVFGSEGNPHYVLLIGALAVAAFFLIESQRYQEYDAWRHRVRILQRHFLANISDTDSHVDTAWRDRLASDLRDPELSISFGRAAAHRLTRVSLLLLTVLLAALPLRIAVLERDESWTQTAAIADVPGLVVVGVVAGIYSRLCLLVLWSIYGGLTREFGQESVTNE